MMQNNSIRPALPHVDFHGGRALIPRQERPEAHSASARKTRAQKACTSCRKRKSKCSGVTPQCNECAANDLSCVYEHNRRDRVKELTTQKQLLVDLVHELRLSADSSGRQQIEDVLDELEEEYPPLPDDALQETDETFEDDNVGLVSIPGQVNPAIAEGVNIMDFWAATQIPNFLQEHDVGNTHWTPSLHGEPQEVAGESPLCRIEGNTALKYTPDASFYLPDNVLAIDPFVAPYETPPADVAYRLIPHYLHTCHEWIPLLPYDFEAQVAQYYNLQNEVTNKWLAIFNLVLAIGARQSYMTNRTAPASIAKVREDLPYISRAIHLLGLKDSALMITDPDLLQVQCHGLLSLYYLTAHQIDKAWLTVGVALRYSVALNLHLRCQDDYPYSGRSETLARTWWSLRSLDCFLSSTIGRPTAFPIQDSNTPLPRDQPTTQHGMSSASTLQIYTRISIITQWALSTLHTIRAATMPWQEIQDRVVKLKTGLEALLPQISDRERLMLHFSWFDSMILITRPMLSPQRSQHDLSDQMRHVSDAMARDCVQAARGVTRLLPDEPDERIFRNGPWWCLAHYIMRAMAVFLLAMSPQVLQVHTDLVLPVKKLIRWLQWMRQDDPVASHGLNAVLNTLRKGVNQMDFASVFEQEPLDEYGTEYLHSAGGWPVAAEPQYMSDFQVFDDYMVAGGANQGLGIHAQPDLLPMPPTYGNPYADNNAAWGADGW
ncbi:fungal-specific transcription factor domain-containing protein [Paraphoma chrysanthemicola]|uniref:Fungal-specific transcription factor domain-containing protein n=1 Tax=Paraphoma chrysanthemicola TaxID=798071 RepID=A0A8K0RDA9_9PLEO|nr:fungal-specific transcription factor domain-containing protein [Paraphoma chrysanthemicola]